MKKLLYLCFTLLCPGIAAHSQMNIFDDIDLGPISGNLQDIPTPGNWGVTHGTPSYQSTKIWMWASRNQNGKEGEGVYRKLDIKDGGNYYIKLGITQFLNDDPSTTEGFVVLLANDPLPVNCGSVHGCPIPTFNGTRLLYDYQGPSFTSNELTLKFSTAIDESYKYLIVYPKQETYSQFHVELEITCVVALGCAASDKTYCGIIPAGDKYYNNISIGTSFCGLSGSASISPSGNIHLLATQRITLAPNTTMSVNSGQTCIMEIAPCEVSLPNILPGQIEASLTPSASLCAAGKPAGEDQTTAIASLTAQDVMISPNPTRDLVQITQPSVTRNESTISIMRMDGKLLKTITTKGRQETISLKEYPNGIYLIRISSGEQSIIKKVVKTD